ncbi:MAG: ATP-dependent Clp protease proteolytic subunit [Candidatus Raymondbacteria bacterium RifOxyC12_full_50_8]|uniref:ATP-dependent Clp protease proteolytic subunit n=1 Tax=Candidatus Raymondbacteria bacterium RIFOXYD12_FULL_49_13 TaxID=1817890 RepID=A0A1F7F9L4_UNCRA|nr:MAG: ATP-dependent Clp protease proteolytic subunit [Candidatus Raymondbacteria bacterium RIFOXYA2_FULL_49_16]OGJ91849.1 MAG: ATP-dependent Clp protease proteolytic subunit [Candidatus Raymondbacteria bacterium RifOxyB12_full_50_8]OGJ95492.1 MAG: ATP-dependent Clp protease proteolytic subunit [Candidatus Raymondbacteria bacterium RifOxyC12_full_50_8]OGJ97191.1 MAG: ATP-dependent Clp protease proteolytic subunit [Candidatus Raymondbacteria bacterium RIFOXYC2_FULL_50_21]OGK03217.1 MAG: ATP-dep
MCAEDNGKKQTVENMLEERLLEKREVFLWGAIDDQSAEKIVKRILYLNSQGSDDITMYLNSPGGIISSGLAIYDAMQASKAAVSTVCMGQAASMGAVILCAGAKGKRLIWPNARVMIHQPLISGSMFGPATDLQIQAEEMLRIRSRLNEILGKHCGRKIDDVEKDTDRDNYLSAQQAIDYGLVDKIV